MWTPSTSTTIIIDDPTDGFGALLSARRMNIHNNNALCELEARLLQQSSASPNNSGFFRNNQGQLDACGTCGGNASSLAECPSETRENPIIFRAAEVAAYAAACFTEYDWFEKFWQLVTAADTNAIGVAAPSMHSTAGTAALYRMARYESLKWHQAIDGLNRLSFRSADDSFYNIDDTNEMDDQLSMVGNRSSAIAKAAAINASTDRHGITATATPSVANIGAVAAADFTETDNLIVNGQRIIGISTQINDADGTLVTAINAVSDKQVWSRLRHGRRLGAHSTGRS